MQLEALGGVRVGAAVEVAVVVVEVVERCACCGGGRDAGVVLPFLRHGWLVGRRGGGC